MSTNCLALVIEPEQQPRAILKEALSAVPQLRGAICVPSFREAQSVMASEAPFEVIFVSDRLGMEAVATFIASAKESSKGRDAAYILLLSAAPEHWSLQSCLIKGADGFLVQPYSINALHEIILLAERVKGERRAARVKSAMQLLVKELGYQIDRIANMQRAGHPADLSKKIFTEMCSVLKEFEPELVALYFEMLTEAFEKAVPDIPFNGIDRRYKGASRRIQEKIAAQALQQIKTAFAA